MERKDIIKLVIRNVTKASKNNSTVIAINDGVRIGYYDTTYMREPLVKSPTEWANGLSFFMKVNNMDTDKLTLIIE